MAELAYNNTMPSFSRDNKTYSSPYANLSGYQSSFNHLVEQLGSLRSDSDVARQGRLTALNNIGEQFKTQFKNLVGRDASSDELNTFYTQVGGSAIENSPLGRPENDQANIRNQIVQHIGDNYQHAASDVATQKLQDQQSQFNDLSNLFRTQGKAAISSTENGLLDYQQRLFERLRPNLITSLQSQGLLNTGALDESLAGAQKDLATGAQGFLIDANMQNEQGANAIAYGGAAAPTLFQQQQITQGPDALRQGGADALNKVFGTYMDNLDYQHQLGLMAQQNKYAQDNQPSFLRTFGQSAASSLGSNFNIPSWISAARGGGSGAQMYGGKTA